LVETFTLGNGLTVVIRENHSSPVVAVQVWYWMTNFHNGVLNHILTELGLGDSYRVLTSHQDQVESLPPDAEVLGWNEHCPVSMLRVGGTLIGIQGHPEFDAEYSAALMEMRRGTVIPEEAADAGLASLDEPSDSSRLADWIMDRISSGSGRSG